MTRLSSVKHVPPGFVLFDYHPGDIGRPYPGQPKRWFIACPACGGKFSLSNHTVTEHDDGTLTISPSLICPGGRIPCQAHYFVQRDVISWVS